MRTSNPALSEKTFRDLPAAAERMTLEGTVNKSFALIGLLLMTAIWSWQNAVTDNPLSPLGKEVIIPSWYLPLIFASFVIGIVIIFAKKTSPFLAPAYALGEGLMLGTLSAYFELLYPGIVLQAVLLTAGVFLTLLLAYRTKFIRATENFKLGVVAATGGIAILYLIDLGLHFWGGRQVPFIHETGLYGILFSLFVVVIAALNLVLDFDFIEKGAEQGAPKYMEWYASFGLLVTLVWLYLEILRLLAKTRKK
ncbi:MAG: Bax inhibitor-1/YccA family protein [Bdellovibrionota bacterium]